jgi:hypothetical protein
MIAAATIQIPNLESVRRSSLGYFGQTVFSEIHRPRPNHQLQRCPQISVAPFRPLIWLRQLQRLGHIRLPYHRHETRCTVDRFCSRNQPVILGSHTLRDKNDPLLHFRLCSSEYVTQRPTYQHAIPPNTAPTSASPKL